MTPLSGITQPLRIVVVDDHGIVREGLMALLEGQDGMTVVGSAATGKAAILAAERLKPDVIIMDLVLPDLNGIDATQRILRSRPLTHVIALSASHTIEHVYRHSGPAHAVTWSKTQKAPNWCRPCAVSAPASNS